jgi:hypothetical protein
MDTVAHPLVAELVQQLLKQRRVKRLTDEKIESIAGKLAPGDAKVTAARQAPFTDAERKDLWDAIDGSGVLNKAGKDLSDKERTLLVDLAEGIDFPDLVALAGYLGGTIARNPPGREKWRILYLDSQLQNWRLVPDEDILVSTSMYAEDAAFNLRDVIWVDRDSLTASGGAPPRPEEQVKYLRGDFTRAGDLAAPGAGGGPSADPQTGVFCPITPRCCTRPVRP